MLEVTIKKVMHAGRERADKIEPYIKECDVFGHEAAGRNEENAIAAETQWEGFLLRGATPVEYGEFGLSTRNSEEVNAWGRRVNELMYQERKSLWLVERFPSQEAESLRVGFFGEGLLVTMATQSLQAGQLDNFYSLMEKAYEIKIQIADYRDKHIAKNIQKAEEALRQRYASVREQDPLHLLVVLGLAHVPERYINASDQLTVTAKEFINEEVKETVGYALLRALQGEDAPEKRRLSLAERLFVLYNLPEQQLLQSSMEELLRLLEEQRKKG